MTNTASDNHELMCTPMRRLFWRALLAFACWGAWQDANAQIAFSYNVVYGGRPLAVHVVYPSSIIGKHHEYRHFMTEKLRLMSPAEAQERNGNALKILQLAQSFVVSNSTNSWQDTPGGEHLLDALKFIDARSSYGVITDGDRVVAVMRCQTKSRVDDSLQLNQRLGLPTPPDTYKNKLRPEWLYMVKNDATAILPAAASPTMPSLRLAALAEPSELLSHSGMTAALMHYNLSSEGRFLFPLLLATLESHGALSYSATTTADGYVVMNETFELDTHGGARERLFKAQGFETVGDPIDDPHIKGTKTIKMRATRDRLLQSVMKTLRSDADNLNELRFDPQQISLSSCNDLASRLLP